jgi:hypothetical protein
MGTRYFVALAIGTLMATSAYAATNAACDENFSASLRDCQRIVGSLHPDKPTQMRVFAADGSEFTAGQATWLKGQLRLIAEACASGHAAEASHRLIEVQKVLSEHHRAA